MAKKISKLFKSLVGFVKSFNEFRKLRNEMLELRSELDMRGITGERISEITTRLEVIFKRMNELVTYIKRVGPRLKLMLIIINTLLTIAIIKLSWDFFWQPSVAITNSFYQVTAQIIPVFLIAILIETRNTMVEKWSFFADLIGLYFPCFTVLLLSLIAVAGNLETSQLIFPIITSITLMFSNILLGIYFSIDDKKLSRS